MALSSRATETAIRDALLKFKCDSGDGNYIHCPTEHIVAADGLALVPEEPTEAMRIAALQRHLPKQIGEQDCAASAMYFDNQNDCNVGEADHSPRG